MFYHFNGIFFNRLLVSFKFHLNSVDPKNKTENVRSAKELATKHRLKIEKCTETVNSIKATTGEMKSKRTKNGQLKGQAAKKRCLRSGSNEENSERFLFIFLCCQIFTLEYFEITH